MENNEMLVTEEVNENVVEQPTEEVVVEDSPKEESNEKSDDSKKLYTEEELQEYLKKEVDAKVDEILPKKIARKEAKIRKEYDSKYGRTEAVLKAGLGIDNLEEATNKMEEYYRSKGVPIPEVSVSNYSKEENEILADANAKKIIDLGYEEIVEEINELASKGTDKLNEREKLIFVKLMDAKKEIDDKKELSKNGINNDILLDKEFLEFKKLFDKSVPINKIYDMYSDMHSSKKEEAFESIGDLKTTDSSDDKEFYSSEEVDKLTREQLRDPKIFDKVMKSMSQWK